MPEQVTTGTPIALLIENEDARSKDYDDIRDKFRPGHADYTYWAKYGVRDYRGGGRQSARETATRVAAGAIARKILHRLYGQVTVRAALIQMGPHQIERSRWDWNCVTENPFNSPDPAVVNQWSDYLEGLRKSGSSCGAIIEVVAEGIPAGLGAPVYGKLDADIAAALMSINAVKGVEIGAGMKAAELTGEENADEMRRGGDGQPVFLSICRRNSGRHFQWSADRGALLGQTDLVYSDTAQNHRRQRQRDRDFHQRAARSVRRYPRGAGGRSHGGLCTR